MLFGGVRDASRLSLGRLFGRPKGDWTALATGSAQHLLAKSFWEGLWNRYEAILEAIF